jgi:N,N'-diacetyllegionaminate synthase
MKQTRLELGSRPLGEGQPCVVVAHVGAAHEGSPDAARRLIDAAFQAGADAIVFQVFRADALLVARHPERKAMEQIELGARDWARVLQAAKGSGLAVVAEALDVASRDVAAEAGVDAFQANATDLDHPELLRALAAVGRPLFIGVGPGSVIDPPTYPPPRRGEGPLGAGMGRASGGPVREALDLAGPQVALVLCPPEAPSAIEEMHLRELPVWRERHRVPVGLLDSTDGGSAFALLAPALAAAHGADFVEKRLTLDRSRKGRDWVAAMSPGEFYRMVELLRQAERARGDGATGGETTSPPAAARGRSIVAATLIGRGDVLRAEMLAFKRTDERLGRGLAPREAYRVIGRKAARPIQADETIREEMLE